ncbi:MAG TPA: hypothetical protein O0Y16_03335, partial [Methanocorpusculum sp.]|nr:hypothetical protein [Methanocorpusculum sp.]
HPNRRINQSRAEDKEAAQSQAQRLPAHLPDKTKPTSKNQHQTKLKKKENGKNPIIISSE